MNIRMKQEGTVLTVYVEGMLNALTAPELDKVLREAAAEELVLDMEKLEYISSAGLRVLITAQKRMELRGSIRLVHVCPGVKEVFDITGLSGVFSIE